MKTIISQEYRKEEYMHEAGSMQGVRIMPLSRLIGTESPQDETVLCLSLRRKVAAHAEDYDRCSQMFAFPAFFAEVISFARMMREWKIEPDQLPASSESDRQLQQLLQEALTLIPQNETDLSAIDTKDLQILWGFEKNYRNHTILKELEERGAKRIPYPAVPSEKHLYHALSTRREIEAAAQQICTEGISCNVVLCSPDTQMPVLQQVFARYGIPYSSYCSTSQLRIPGQFLWLVRFGLAKNAETLFECIRRNAFGITCPGDLLAWLEETLTGTDAPQIAAEYEDLMAMLHSRENDTVRDKTVKRINDLQKQTDNYFSLISPDLQKLLQAESPQDVLKTSYEIIGHSQLLKQDAERAAGMRIGSVLNECLPLVQEETEAHFIAESLIFLHASSSSYTTDFCAVTDLTHPVSVRNKTYVIGCSGTGYPGFTAMEGLFDEAYAAEVPGFPSLKDRQNAWTEQLSWIEGSAPVIEYSYPTNDYQGREILPAYEITSMPDLPRREDGEVLDRRRTILHTDPRRSMKHSLSQDTAKALFLKKDEAGNEYIRGSISSIETWFSCPYKYFISSGLFVRKNELPSLAVNHIGTVQHAVMENAVKENEKDYARLLSEEQIRALIRPYFDQIRLLHPARDHMTAMSEDRMTRSLLRCADFLAEYEQNTVFTPARPEMHFNDFPISEHVRLNGTIDRVNYDEGNHAVSILDYKSSTKNLTEATVQNGQHLQLLSYLMTAVQLMQDELNEEVSPAGAYYFSMKSEDITKTPAMSAKHPAGKNSEWSAEEYDYRTDPDQAEAMIRASRQMTGWRFTDLPETLDSSGDHIRGLKDRYDFEAVKDCLNTLYEYFYEQLLQSDPDAGGISLTPVKEACTFCDYKGICRFHGDFRDAEQICEEPLKIRKVKGGKA